MILKKLKKELFKIKILNSIFAHFLKFKKNDKE